MEQENIRYILDKIISKARYNAQTDKYEIKEEDYINLNLTVKQKRLLKIICKNSQISLELTSKILPSKEDEQIFKEYNEIKKKLILNPQSKELEQRRIEIRNQIATDNIKLIKTIIDRRFNENHYIQDIEDIYQMGYEFLLEYIDKNYLTKDTFKNNISSRILLYIHRRNSNYEEGVGYRTKDDISTLKKEKENNPTIEIDELSEKTKIDPTRIEKLLSIEESLPLVSLDEEIDILNAQENSDNSPLYDDSFESNLIDNYSKQEIVSKIIQTLSEKEREILTLYYGFNTGIDYTIIEIAKMYKVSKEAIFTVIKRALEKIKTSIRIKYLKEIYDASDKYEYTEYEKETKLEEFLIKYLSKDTIYQIITKINPRKKEYSFAYIFFYEEEYELNKITNTLNITLKQLYQLKNKTIKYFRDELINILSQERNKKVTYQDYLEYLMELYLHKNKVRKRGI